MMMIIIIIIIIIRESRCICVYITFVQVRLHVLKFVVVVTFYFHIQRFNNNGRNNINEEYVDLYVYYFP